MNSVDSLLKQPFSVRTIEQKIEIKRLGRPTPDLNITQSVKRNKNSTYFRRFNKKIYEEYNWICGCSLRNALFCFPLVKYRGKGPGSFDRICKKHSVSINHVNNMLDFSSLGHVNIAVQLSRAYQNSIQRHNNQVEKNRYILSKIINCLKFCGSFELALRCHDESNDSNQSHLVIFLGMN